MNEDDVVRQLEKLSTRSRLTQASAIVGALLVVSALLLNIVAFVGLYTRQISDSLNLDYVKYSENLSAASIAIWLVFYGSYIYWMKQTVAITSIVSQEGRPSRSDNVIFNHLMPIVSWYRPLQMLKQVWEFIGIRRAYIEGTQDVLPRIVPSSAPMVLTVWWCLMLVVLGIGVALKNYTPKDIYSTSEFTALAIIDSARAVVWILAYVLAAVIVGMTTRSIRETYGSLNARVLTPSTLRETQDDAGMAYRSPSRFQTAFGKVLLVAFMMASIVVPRLYISNQVTTAGGSQEDTGGHSGWSGSDASRTSAIKPSQNAIAMKKLYDEYNQIVAERDECIQRLNAYRADMDYYETNGMGDEYNDLVPYHNQEIYRIRDLEEEMHRTMQEVQRLRRMK